MRLPRGELCRNRDDRAKMSDVRFRTPRPFFLGENSPIRTPILLILSLLV